MESSHAQSLPRSHRDAAIALGEEGLVLLQAGDHAAALRKFDAADELIPAPTFGVRAASCLESLGRLVEALERYERVAAMAVDPSWPQIHTEAQEQARQKASSLRMRVPYLRVVLQGESDHTPTFKLDGRPAPVAALTSKVLLNPGVHVLEISFQGKSDLRRFQVREGDHHQEHVVLGPVSEEARSTSAYRTAGWVSMGLGAAGVALGSAAGLVAWSKKADLEDRCPNRICPSSAWSDHAAYDRWRKVSTVGFAVGAVGLGFGTVLLLVDPKKPVEVGRITVEPFVDVGSFGVQGAF